MADSQRYLVTARKYRPKLFREVVAQEHVTDTLKNALRLDRLAHAYLFSGPRGVGKTTSARILAKAINCETPRSEREDEAEPCCECDSCLSFEDGRSMNVFEMDAASNNKVDDIRELRETVRIPPQGSTKKVYILDEVHMLSTAAFNALLKTLEEPPPHALFIFATTEPHKVLPTILSRCQRFDFRRIPVPNMVEHLRTICEEEDIDADEESLMLLARKGDGALRDALSAFDQAISLCGTTIEYGELTQALGVVDQDLFFQLTDHVVERSTAGVLKLVHHVVRNGYDLNEFLSGVAEHIRNLLVAHSLGTDALEDVAESTRDRYEEDSRAFSESDLLRLLMITGEAEEDVKNTSQPRLKLEMALLKMASLTRSADLRTVLGKIDRLERMVDEGEIPDDLPLGNGAGTAGGASNPESTAESASASDVPSQRAGSGDRDAEDDTAAAPSTTDESSTAEAGDAAGSDSAAGAGGAATQTAAPPATDTARREKPAQDPEAESADEAADGEKRAVAEAEEGTESDEDDADDTTGGVASADDSGDDAGDGSGGSGIQPQDLFGTPALQGKKKSSDDGGRPENQASALTGDAAPAGDTGVPEARPSGEPDAREDRIMRELKEVWPDLIKKVKADRIGVGTQLGPTKPVGFDNGIAEIGVPDNLTRERLRDKQRYLLNALLDSWELDVESLRFVVREPEENEEDDGAPEEKMPLDPHEMLTQLRERYPSVDTLVNEFGAEPAY
ncbi:MAG: DNA polymerase III subunit gamma/tau [Bacteroidetes bacterium]|jgi:DNA polymerase-3 subunit gamma/tau|nr:DNA polymerase III subunit gamma/tau [Bacteroidota bacterium]